jgi:hypothetical protein
MVRAQENWSVIDGTVRRVADDPELPDYLVAEVDIEGVEAVERPEAGVHANMLGESVGGTLRICIHKEVAKAHRVVEGCRLTAHVRRATPTRCFVDPDHISVT